MSNLILFNILIYHIFKKYAKIDVSLIELYGWLPGVCGMWQRERRRGCRVVQSALLPRILLILFYRAGVYWNYILSILPGYLGWKFRYTSGGKKNASSRDELKNTPPYFPIKPSSRQCIIINNPNPSPHPYLGPSWAVSKKSQEKHQKKEEENWGWQLSSWQMYSFRGW